jgi:hypothetical protein
VRHPDPIPPLRRNFP